MEIEYTLGEDDLRAYLRRVIWSSGQARWMVAVVAGGLVFGVLLAVFRTAQLRALGVVLSLSMGYVLFLVMRSDVRQLRVLQRTRDARLVLGPQRLALTADGIAWRGALSHTYYAWRAVERIDEGRGFAALMMSGVRGYIVPKRAFAGEGDYVRFIETAKRLRREAEERETSTRAVA